MEQAMNLYEIKNINLNLLKGIVESIAIKKIFYVTIRRNAWHSTNIGRYQAGCMHVNLDRAKEFAKNLRKNGSTIYIEEIPALIIQGDFVTAIVTQINCDEIMQGYHYYDDEPESIIEPGDLISNSISHFDEESFAWKTPPKKNSIMRLATYLKIKDFEEYNIDEIFIHKSIFNRGVLLWECEKNKNYKKTKALKRICSESLENFDKNQDIDLLKIKSMISVISNLKPWSEESLYYIKENIDISECCKDEDKSRYFIGLSNIATLLSQGLDLSTLSEEIQDIFISNTINTSVLRVDGVFCWEIASITNIEIFGDILVKTMLFKEGHIKSCVDRASKRLLSTTKSK